MNTLVFAKKSGIPVVETSRGTELTDNSHSELINIKQVFDYNFSLQYCSLLTNIVILFFVNVLK